MLSVRILVICGEYFYLFGVIGHKKRPLDCSKGLKEGGDPDESGQALLSHTPWPTSTIGAAGLIRRGGSGWEEAN